MYDSKHDLMAVFHVDITYDSMTNHPSQFCEKCKTVLAKSKKATESVQTQCEDPGVASLYVLSLWEEDQKT